ncbi:SprT family zinc-dependent metalloprotease [Sphingomonas sp.]|jgi:predicted metal-dependent hydrolase|uniref:M48 family metallopeptidase n=1 Tax=Sphingomonas sp. TaxID=28214 RepID=UPI00263666DD|nr:SprT family zinc-dependent metalloprotease [Sphingomonas sp.]MDF2495843.1 metal-dependent hydrolase [Sphingomonas sp.]
MAPGHLGPAANLTIADTDPYTTPADVIDVVRHPTARRVKLSFDPLSGRVRLTIPKRASATKALSWAAQYGEWIAAQRERLPQARPFVDGAQIPFGGGLLTIAWQPGASRIVRREGDSLTLSGPAETVARRVEAWLRREALSLLESDTRFYADRAGVTVERISIGDPRGRWGSCTTAGAIRYSWRLALAPVAVRRATAAHEVAHRIHMDHSPAFHALVERLYGSDPTPHRRWLRTHGATLHWYGRSSAGGG